MSSIIGHTLTAGVIYACSSSTSSHPESFLKKGVWFGCLVLAATAPDMDYFVSWLSKSSHDGLRVSNSIAFSLLVPSIVTLVLVMMKVKGGELRQRALQLILAGLSHIVLDYCVGVHPLPLFWPIYDGAFIAPIGILPSAGALDLTNYYLYRNLLIELGILIPLYVMVFLIVRRKQGVPRSLFVWSALLVIFLSFLVWSISLGR